MAFRILFCFLITIPFGWAQDYKKDFDKDFETLRIQEARSAFKRMAYQTNTNTGKVRRIRRAVEREIAT